MNVLRIAKLIHPDALLRGERDQFYSLAPVTYDEAGMVTYAVNAEWAVKARDNPRVSAVLVRQRDVPDELGDKTWILVEEPWLSFVVLHNLLAEEGFYGPVAPSYIAPNAKVPKRANVDRYGVVVESGADVHPSATLREGTHVCEGARIGPGAVVGQDGARFVDLDGQRLHIRHVGGVWVGRGAIVGANAVIVRGVWRRPTRIGDEAFVGNLANVGHNCQIGDRAVVLPGAVLCGSVMVGAGATIGPGAVVADHLTIGAGATVTMGSVVTREVAAGATVSGHFAMDHSKWLRFVKETAMWPIIPLVGRGKGTV